MLGQPIFARGVKIKSSILVALTGLTIIGQAGAGPVVSPNYSISVFATSGTGYSAPDSIVVDNGSVWVGYGNGLNGDGTIGSTSKIGNSTIVQYSQNSGAILNTYTVSGHNDGLKINPTTHNVWALQNEDANSNLSIIQPGTHEQINYNVGTGPHGGGYDDIVFLRNNVYLSASNPNFSGTVNTQPVILQAALDNTTHMVSTQPVLYSSASLNITDPDSMTSDLKGRPVLTDQSGSQVISVNDPGTSSQAATPLSLSSSGTPANINDSLFVPSSHMEPMYVTDSKADTVYTVSGLLAGHDFAAVKGTTGFLASLDPATGHLSPVVTGISPAGLAISPVPEPSELSLMLLGLGLIGFIATHRSKGTVGRQLV